MIKGKSLSDSSTSESEDDCVKNKLKKSLNLPTMYERKMLKFSDADNVESDSYSLQEYECSTKHNNNVLPFQCKNEPSKPFKRKLENQANDNDYKLKHSKPSVDFKAPLKCSEIDSSTSESEDDFGKRAMFQQNVSLSASNNAVVKYNSSASESEDDFMNKPSFSANISDLHSNSAKDEKGNHKKTPLYGGIGSQLMSKMGWSAGEGLGKHGQGRTEIVEASKQRGRRGLGLHITGFEPADVKWDSEQEHETVEEEVCWFPECIHEVLDIKLLREWKKFGEKKQSISDETEFCDPEVLKDILSYKNAFDELENEEMRKARTRSNPFETIRGGIFLNRAAMKMANMDANFDFMFSNPTDIQGISMVGSDELLYFADICAGPGGFSEYILWRRGWGSKGFGFTLKGPNDFKLEDFFSGPPETFEPFYGVGGLEGDGDIYLPQNLREFQKFVLANTDNKGVHFVMADGGFSVEGQENLQEILSKRLYLCQFLCALMIVRTGGHFVCKLFDLFTPFSVGLVYLLYHTFEKVCIHKPNTSRPANSERYVICKWRKENTKDVCDYMYEINDSLDRCSVTTSEDVVEVVPLSILKEDIEFNQYIVESNNSFGRRQVIHLDKIRTFVKNTELHEQLQSDFRKRCLAAWKVPDQARQAPTRADPNLKFRELMNGTKLDFLKSEAKELKEEHLTELNNLFNFKCVVCGELNPNTQSFRGFFLGLGRTNIYRLDPKNGKWVKADDVKMELPANTLLYAELIPELKGEGKAQRRIMCLQVIDALFLGGKDVRSLSFEDRTSLARKLAKAVSKPSRSDYIPIKIKRIWELYNISDILNNLEMKSVKGSGKIPRLCFETEDDRHFIPSGLLIFDTIATPWVTAFSKSQKKVYYFNTKNRVSKFEPIQESAADFVRTFTKRMLWNWSKGVQLLPNQNVEHGESAIQSGQMFHSFIMSKMAAFTSSH